MKRKHRIFLALFFLAGFLLWTLLVLTLDVKPIGPRGSAVGFASLNGFFHKLTGVHMLLYTVTDWLGLVPIAVALGFALFGLFQWIRRRSILKVDRSILALGVFYLLVIAAYVVFEFVVINRRPVLINGYLEASYPSSTTLLITTVMPTALLQLYGRIKGKTVRRCAGLLISAFIAFMVVGSLFSGVHWLSDIIGGLLLSGGLVLAYDASSY